MTIQCGFSINTGHVLVLLPGCGCLHYACVVRSIERLWICVVVNIESQEGRGGCKGTGCSGGVESGVTLIITSLFVGDKWK